jgi:hypothetical protein
MGNDCLMTIDGTDFRVPLVLMFDFPFGEEKPTERINVNCLFGHHFVRHISSNPIGA